MLNYDHLATEYAVHRQVHPDVVRRIVEGAGLTKHSQVLEVGCGTGNYARALHQATRCTCYGVDPSREMLARAESLANDEPQALTLRVGRAEALDFTSGSFDLVFSVDVIHHVADRRAAFQEMHRVLVPGGRVCTVTDSESIIRRRAPLAVYFPDTIDVDLARYPSLETLRQLMRDAGFDDVREETVELAFESTDIQNYRDRAFSCLHLISDAAFQAGIARMEKDLRDGPIECVSRYGLVWGKRPKT